MDWQHHRVVVVRAAAGMAAAVTVAASLAGCTPTKSPKDQLAEITAVTGNQIFAMDVTVAGATKRDNVSVSTTRDGTTGSYALNDGKVASQGSFDPPVGVLMDVSAFPSIDTLTELAKTTHKEEDNCAPTTARAATTPSGAIATWVECNNRQDHPAVDGKATINGEPLLIPALDLTTAQSYTAIDQAVTQLFGTPNISDILYDVESRRIVISSGETINTQGEPCHASIGATTTQPTTPLPLTCSGMAGPPFAINDYGPDTIANTITSLLTSPHIDVAAISGITFTGGDNGTLHWEANSHNLADRKDKKQYLEGNIPKR
ncbi:hypothetical protein [Propionibacterium sp. oral taxon 192]|uniref:hypothetical protein n=1 Tax=Propionibacterium sp. oral taxon 192 TaxID=671222 RepID=UPI0012EB7C3E|nr:hypothetical protein [Propionibacterium sp. oral taxon 192]